MHADTWPDINNAVKLELKNGRDGAMGDSIFSFCVDTDWLNCFSSGMILIVDILLKFSEVSGVATRRNVTSNKVKIFELSENLSGHGYFDETAVVIDHNLYLLCKTRWGMVMSGILPWYSQNWLWHTFYGSIYIIIIRPAQVRIKFCWFCQCILSELFHSWTEATTDIKLFRIDFSNINRFEIKSICSIKRYNMVKIKITWELYKIQDIGTKRDSFRNDAGV